MSEKDGNASMGLDRLNAVLAWWGIPNANINGQIDDQMKRLQTFASGLQKACGEAYSDQMRAPLSANERIATSLQELLRCRQPKDVIAAESIVLATILESASLQAKTWVQFTQKVQDCCAAMAREAADEIRKEAAAAATKSPPKPAPASAKDASKNLAHA
jgi:hypothetical protein